jgi:hypothetical protein
MVSLTKASFYNPKYHHASTAANPDYFMNQPGCDRLKSIKGTTFNTVRELKEQLVNRLNEDIGDDCIGVRNNNCTGKYVILDCNLAGCNYQHWFEYVNKSGTPTNITFFRNINQSHSISAHENRKLKTNEYY